MKHLLTITTLLLLLVTTGCGRLRLYNYESDDEVLASVGNKKLYRNDLQHLFVNGSYTPEDSLQIAAKYIESWVKNQVKISAAEAAFTADQDEIDNLVEKYRISLLAYRYEEQVVKSQMDTLVTFEQIEQYYNDHRDNFRLIGPIVKATIARIPALDRNNDKLEKLFLKDGEQSAMEFAAICQKNNYRLHDYSQQWKDFSEVVTTIPFTSSDFDEFLRTHKYYEVADDTYKYMMKISGYRPTGDYAPLENVSATIERIIRNNRRTEIIRNLEDSLMRVATDNQTITIKTDKDQQ